MRDQDRDFGFIALSDTPWLRLPVNAFAPGRFVEVRYAANIYDVPARPLLRFWRADRSYREEILPAPTEGAALWMGRAPKDCVEVWISPTNRPGPFDFRIDWVRPAPLGRLLRRAAGAPKRLFFAASAGMVGLTAESDLNWRFALGAQPLADYAAWRQERRRPAEPSFDWPRESWRERVTIVIETGGGTDVTRRSVESQTYPHRQSVVLGVDAPDIGPDGFVIFLRAGDRLEPEACASFVEYFAREPGKVLVYADETLAGQPRFRPAWSPTLHRFENFVGRAACFRASLLDAIPGWRRTAPELLIDRLIDAGGPDAVGALPRMLFEMSAPGETPSRPKFDAVFHGEAPSVSILVPTRDRVDLLEPCLESVLAKTDYRRFDLLVIDNDSVDPRTHALLDRLSRADSRLRVLPQPGAFNFSALCNAGAAATAGDFLLFLNNDTRIVSPDWIERLLYFASQPDIGAVGAKLLYPSGLTQHAGVLLGMGGVAGHFGADLPEKAPGWWERNQLPHDLSAATAACVMVAREKFDAVGGFDAVALPVELNDVDLCLRLAAKGWRTVCNTQATLVHHQSASRGGGLRLQRVYEGERRAFCERWRAVIRDDPYFHPGLSLYRNEAALP